MNIAGDGRNQTVEHLLWWWIVYTIRVASDPNASSENASSDMTHRNIQENGTTQIGGV